MYLVSLRSAIESRFNNIHRVCTKLTNLNSVSITAVNLFVLTFINVVFYHTKIQQWKLDIKWVNTESVDWGVEAWLGTIHDHWTVQWIFVFRVLVTSRKKEIGIGHFFLFRIVFFGHNGYDPCVPSYVWVITLMKIERIHHTHMSKYLLHCKQLEARNERFLYSKQLP